MDIYKTLLESFQKLPMWMRKNLAFHAKQKTKILCGKNASEWTTKDMKGG